MCYSCEISYSDAKRYPISKVCQGGYIRSNGVKLEKEKNL